jgi:hypothetical protein
METGEINKEKKDLKIERRGTTEREREKMRGRRKIKYEGKAGFVS